MVTGLKVLITGVSYSVLLLSLLLLLLADWLPREAALVDFNIL